MYVSILIRIRIRSTALRFDKNLIPAADSDLLSKGTSPWAIVKIGIFRYNLAGQSPTWRDVRRRYSDHKKPMIAL